MFKGLLSNNKFLLLVVILYTIVTMTPIMGQIIPPLYFGFILVFIVLFFVLTNKTRVQFEFRKIIAFSAFYIGVVLFYWIFGISSASSGNYLLEFRFFLPILLAVLVLNKFSNNQQEAIVFIISTIIAANLIDNIRICALYPEMASYQALGEQLHNFGIIINIGAASYQTMSIFFIYSQLMARHFSTNKSVRLIYLIYAIVALSFVLFCTFKATVVIYSLLALLLFYISTRAKSQSKAIVLVLLFFVILLAFRNEIIHLLSNIIGSDRITSRLLIFASDETVNTDDGALTGRTNLYFLSIQTWLSSPVRFLFGIGYHTDISSGIGQHADLLDLFAKYGLLGASLFWGCIINLYKWLKKICIINVYFLKSLAAIFIICGCTKSVLFPDCGLLIFLLIPLVMNMQNNENNVSI